MDARQEKICPRCQGKGYLRYIRREGIYETLIHNPCPVCDKERAKTNSWNIQGAKEVKESGG